MEGQRQAPSATMELVDTPNAKTINDLVEQFNLSVEKTVQNTDRKRCK